MAVGKAVDLVFVVAAQNLGLFFLFCLVPSNVHKAWEP